MPVVTASYARSFNFIEFFGYIKTLLTSIHVKSTVFSPNFHRLCARLIHKFSYVNMPNVTAGSGYGRFSISITFLGIFHILLHALNMFEMTKLLQTVC